MRYRRLILIGVLLLAVIAPLSLGGVITCVVQARTHHHLNVGIDILLGLWALISVLCVLAGFAALLAGVFIGWRERTAGAQMAHKRSDSV